MERDDIIRMAHEAGFVVDELSKHYQPNCITHTYYLVDELLERFAALVAAHEREACARVCENIEDHDETIDDIYYSDHYANAIRARGEK